MEHHKKPVSFLFQIYALLVRNLIAWFEKSGFCFAGIYGNEASQVEQFEMIKVQCCCGSKCCCMTHFLFRLTFDTYIFHHTKPT